MKFPAAVTNGGRRSTKEGMRRTLLVLCLLPGCASPAPAPLDLEFPKPGPARGEAVLDGLEARAREVLSAIDHPAASTLPREVTRLREQLALSLGLERLPKPQARNVRCTGVIQRPGYRIEKLVYETLPGVEVPAHLYLPQNGTASSPAILFVPGHWWPDAKTKTDFQAFCITAARLGFVVLTYDPVGQGERGISQRDHRRTELLAVGVAQQAIIDFESSCALELLLLRPEVDRTRVGMTGASGGGYNSWIVPSLDPRIAVTVPVVGTSEFHEQLSVVRERDWYDAKEHCHFVPGLLRYANNHEFVAMIAPRPLLIIAAHNDHSFRIPGNRAVAEYAKGLYRSIGAPDRMGYFEDETEGHGYQKKKREAAYGWFLKWLRNEGDGSPREEPTVDPPPWDAPELRCFPAGENRSAGPGLVALARALSALPSSHPDPSAVPALLARALGISLEPRLTASSKLERGPSEPRGGCMVERVSWTGRDDVTVAAVLFSPPGPWAGAILAAADEGKETLAPRPFVREALQAGMAILAADVRGAGELATGKPGWTFAVSLLLGENFVGRQAMDLVGGWRALSVLPELEGKPVAIFGSGPFMAQAALYAAVLEPRVAGVYTQGGFRSFRNFIDRPATAPASYTLARTGEEKAAGIDRELPAALIPFDVLRHFDLSDLAVSIEPRPGWMTDTSDGDFQVHPGPPTSAKDFLAHLAGGPGATSLPNTNVSKAVAPGRMPNRVHVVEDYETDIEKRWWMAGRLETANLPPGSRRACRGTLARDFDDKMGDPSKLYTAVIFNPVPGPPMGKSTHLKFRYWLRGSDRLRIQLFSLTNNYHRHLTLNGLSQGSWQTLAADLTEMRRPDGSGGPLEEGERIDDIQIYAPASAELVIDDIVLYDAAAAEEPEPFPSRVVFTAGFDTGRQGKEWPGEFEIVPHERPLAGRAARSIPGPRGEGGRLRVFLRGMRPLSGGAHRLRFRARLSEGDRFEVALGAGSWSAVETKSGDWAEHRLNIGEGLREADEIRFRTTGRAELWIDDLLLYEP